MRVRPQSATGDYTIGVPFLVNSSAAVAQCVKTRLQLLKGEWFLDTTIGLDINSILGPRASRNPDAAIKQQILGTTGVVSIQAYQGVFNAQTRQYQVTCTVLTQYSNGAGSSSVQISESIKL